jgi:hypothetical protein
MTHPAAALKDILAHAHITDLSPESRRLLEEALSKVMVQCRREGACSQRNHDAALAGCKALLYATDTKMQERYRAFKAVETAIRDGELPL